MMEYCALLAFKDNFPLRCSWNVICFINSPSLLKNCLQLVQEGHNKFKQNFPGYYSTFVRKVNIETPDAVSRFTTSVCITLNHCNLRSFRNTKLPEHSIS